MPLEKRPDGIPHGLRYRGELAGLHQLLEQVNLLPWSSERYPIHHFNHSYLTFSSFMSAICQTIVVFLSDRIRYAIIISVWYKYLLKRLCV